MSTRQFPKVSTAILLAALLIGCNGLSNSPSSPSPSPLSAAPTVLLVVPQTNGVGTNRAVAVVFSTPMDPASINTGSFMIAGVSGAVTYDVVNKIAAFKPAADLAAGVMFNADYYNFSSVT